MRILKNQPLRSSRTVLTSWLLHCKVPLAPPVNPSAPQSSQSPHGLAPGERWQEIRGSGHFSSPPLQTTESSRPATLPLHGSSLHTTLFEVFVLALYHFLLVAMVATTLGTHPSLRELRPPPPSKCLSEYANCFPDGTLGINKPCFPTSDYMLPCFITRVGRGPVCCEIKGPPRKMLLQSSTGRSLLATWKPAHLSSWGPGRAVRCSAYVRLQIMWPYQCIPKTKQSHEVCPHQRSGWFL